MMVTLAVQAQSLTVISKGLTLCCGRTQHGKVPG